MPKKSAGLLIYRFRDNKPEVMLVHPGGPFWHNKEESAWSIPKGEFDETEEPLAAAIREVQEETGLVVDGNFIELAPARQKSGKIIYAWAVEGNVDAAAIKSNSFSMEWPPRSGKEQSFPEVDRSGWFKLPVAREKILIGQLGFLEELKKILGMH